MMRFMGLALQRVNLIRLISLAFVFAIITIAIIFAVSPEPVLAGPNPTGP